VDKVVQRHGTEPVAKAYLQYLYGAEGQEIIARNFYRPGLETVVQKYSNQFPPVKLFTVQEVFGGWQKAQKAHFAEGGTFDQIYQNHP
jgi:ABC-type sulfate transport system substrate-binding protein